MEKKQLIQQQYFDLSRDLNQSNKIQNVIKPMYFYTMYVDNEEKLFAAISDWQKTALCKKKTVNFWVPLHNTRYEELEEEISKITPGCLLQPDLTKCIQKHILGPFT